MPFLSLYPAVAQPGYSINHLLRLTFKFQKVIKINPKEVVFKGKNARKAYKAGKVTSSSHALESTIAGARGETRTPMGCPAGS